MASAIKTAGRRTGRFLLWLGAVVFVLVAIVQLSLGGFMLWLGTKGGQSWIQAQIRTATAESGYDIAFDWVYYNTAKGLSLGNLKISDADGLLLEADRMAVNISLMSLATRSLTASVQGDTVIFHRLPASRNVTEEPEKPFRGLAPFKLPDLYFRTVTLDDLDIRLLDIRRDVFGQALLLSPKLRAHAKLDPALDLSLAGSIRQQGPSPVAWMPETLSFQGMLDPSTLEASLRVLKINARAFALNASGNGNLGETGALDYQISAQAEDLSVLAPGQAGSAILSARLTGPMNMPVLDANGEITLGALTAQGLGKVTTLLHADNLFESPAGTVNISTSWREKPVTLSSAFKYTKPDLQLDTITGSAPELSLSGALLVNTDTLLADGSLTLKASDLETYADLAGTPLDGTAEMKAALSAVDGKQSASMDAHLSQARYESMTLERLDLLAAIADIRNPWPQSLDLKAANLKPSPALTIKNLTTVLKAADAPGTYKLTLNGTGNAGRDFQLRGGADIDGLSSSNPSARAINLVYSARNATLSLTGGIDRQNADLLLTTKNFTLSALPVAIPDKLQNATLTGNASLKGSLSAPEAAADIRFSPVSMAWSAPKLSVSIQAAYAAKKATAAMTGKGQGVHVLTAKASLPLTFSLQPFAFDMPKATPLSGNFALDLDGRVLAESFLPPDHVASGAIKGQGTLNGTLAAPDVKGTLSVLSGSYTYTPEDMRLRDIALQARFDRSKATITSFSATDGETGALKGSGYAGITDPADTSIDLTARNFHLLRSDRANGSLSAQLDIKGRPGGYAIGGNVDLNQFDIVIPERFQTNIPQLNIVKANRKGGNESLQTVALDVDVKGDNRIFVRGWGLDAEFGGDLDITGALDKPLVNGTFKSIRGRYDEFGKRFALERANLRFQGTIPPSPYLDIEATTDAGDVKASILLTGPVAQPAIKLASTPALPEDEVLSRILFGKNMSRITPFQAIQLAQTLQRFSGKGGGGFDPLGKLRTVTGLDDIRVDTDAEGESSVGVGKYLTDKVYLEVEKGRAETSGTANIQIEVTPDITLESKIGQDAQAGAGVVWKRDY